MARDRRGLINEEVELTQLGDEEGRVQLGSDMAGQWGDSQGLTHTSEAAADHPEEPVPMGEDGFQSDSILRELIKMTHTV